MTISGTETQLLNSHGGLPPLREAISVGYDGSDTSMCAVKYAAADARRAHRPLLLLTVGSDDKLNLDRLTASMRLHYPELVVRSDRMDGDPVSRLLDCSSAQAKLVVGRRGLSPLGRLALGSTSIAVAGRSEVPVVIVPAGWPGRRPQDLRAEPVVVGIDLEQDNDDLLAFAFTEAESRGVGLVAIATVAPAPDVEPGLAIRQPVAEEQLDAMLRSQGRHHRRVPAHAETFVGYPVPVLMRAALGTPLLIVGRRSSGRFGFRMGSVAREVLHRAEVPVAVLPLG